MAKTPTPEQQKFIDLYIIGSRKQDAKMTKAFLEFDRRRGKVAEEIAVLDPTDPERTRLQNLLDAAVTKGHGPEDRSAPNFEGAYKDLNAIKREARAKAKGFIKSHSPKAIARDLAAMEATILTIKNNMALAANTMDLAIQDIIKAAPDRITEEELEDFLYDVSSREAGWRGMKASAERTTRVAEQAVASLDAEAAIARHRHAIQQVFNESDTKARVVLQQLNERLNAIETEARFGGAQFITAERVRQPTIDKGVVFEDKLLGLLTLHKRDLRQDTGDRFAHLEQREKEILGIALNQYYQDFGNDQLVLDPNFRTGEQRPKTPPVLRQFHVGDMVDDDFVKTKEEDLDTNAIETKAQAVQDNVLQLIWDESRVPDSDVLFDLALQNLNGLRLVIGAELGLGQDIEEWTPNLRRLVETTAVKIREAIEENLPNQASGDTVTITKGGKDHDVPSSVTINGETYDSPELLGAGGKGMVMRYRLAGGSKDAPTVVVKSTLAGASDQFMTEDQLSDPRPLHTQPEEVRGFKSREEMVKEAKIHRLVCGGQDGTPNKHVVDLKGVVTGKDGALFMVMEEAKSGDVDHLSKAMSGLVRSGIMPKGAQQALMQDTMLQSAKGLKAMQDIGLIHNDIKTMNFFLDDDGTVKIADFGSGETSEQGRDGEAPETTDRFMPPEFMRGRDDKSDVFMLGTMLHNMDAPYGSEGTFGDMPFNFQFGQKAPTGHGTTSLDRLRNAMMDKDPGKRPTLEGVLMSSCLNDARKNFDNPEVVDGPGSDLKPLRLAMAAYVKAAGRAVAAVMTELGETMARYRKAELAAQTKDGDDPAFEQAKQELPGLLKGFQDRLDEINARDDIAPLVKALKEAGKPFGTAEGQVKDRAWDFAYAKTELAMDEIGTGTKAKQRPGSLPQELKEELETVNER